MFKIETGCIGCSWQIIQDCCPDIPVYCGKHTTNRSFSLIEILLHSSDKIVCERLNSLFSSCTLTVDQSILSRCDTLKYSNRQAFFCFAGNLHGTENCG